ncbi:hypothetical protein M947_11235 [Sulfurimonas hongkongensis]|uniref:Inner membrane protein YgaP-like transmembrane domain-containing protein n=1 Tax=Sulfurimonas hongkongensis TaxID=1172190 RepID=T0KCD2_9BACT|nr:DUF2892 domain-containing protein [Sulfurimonas hongkongensis]EQB34389.1 hypothetical protein M947_11235 [Sulfurimonas hongkongensis]
MDFNKIRKFCRVFRIFLGLALIIAGIINYGAFSGAGWFFLGFIPLIAGITNFCPLCMISKKCDMPQNSGK